MSTIVNMWLGIAFVGLALLAVILQAWLWSFPMEPAGDPRGRSLAPRRWTNLHRVVGVLYVLIYVLLMTQMVPRLWEYQVELPARTVVHAVMGITIGVLLVTKFAVIRFFQHFGKSLPAIGLGIFLCTIILTTLSVPFALHAQTLEGNLTDPQEQARIARALGTFSFLLDEKGRSAKIEDLVSEASLLRGRAVLTQKCVTCHDMRAVLARPRSARAWYELVTRMGEKPSFGHPITRQEQWAVTAYLVALSPELQESVAMKREGDKQKAEAAAEVKQKMETPAPPPALDLEKARALYEEQCSQCHKLRKVEAWGKHSRDDWRAQIMRMVEENEAELSPAQAEEIAAYLGATRGL